MMSDEPSRTPLNNSYRSIDQLDEENQPLLNNSNPTTTTTTTTTVDSRAHPLPPPHESTRLYQNSNTSSDSNDDSNSKDHTKKFYVSRYLLFLITLTTTIWIFLNVIDLLTGLSISSPDRGSGFDILFFNIITLLNSKVSILLPSSNPTDQTVSFVVIGLSLLSMLVILVTSQLRHRIGNYSTLISMCLLLLSLILGMYRYPKPLSTTKRITRNFARYFARALLLIVIFLYTVNILIDAKDSRANTSELMDLPGGSKIHFTCTPSGLDGPIAIIEGGESETEQLHHYLQNTNGFKAICSWDRPGFGISDSGPNPLSMAAVGEYLENALQRSTYFNESEKIVLISAGVGSLYSRVFASRTRHEIVGIVLLDPLHEELFYDQETFFKGLKQFVFGMWSLISPAKLQSVLHGLGSEDRLYLDLADHQPRYHKALLQEQIYAKGPSRREIRDSILASNLPLLLLSSEETCLDRTWSRYQRMHLQLTNNPISWKILAGPHEMWRDPEGRKLLVKEIAEYIAHALVS